MTLLQVHRVGGDAVTAHDGCPYRAFGHACPDAGRFEYTAELVDHGRYPIAVDGADRAHQTGSSGAHGRELRDAFAAQVRLAGVPRVIDPVAGLAKIFLEADHLEAEQRKNPERERALGKRLVHPEVVIVAGA